MKVFATDRIVANHQLGAVGYVNSLGCITPRPSSVIWDLLVAGRVEDAEQIERLLSELIATLAHGNLPYDWHDHQAYSKALAAAAGCTVGEVRPPMRSLASIGAEGSETVGKALEVVARLGVVTAAIEERAGPADAFADRVI